MEIKDFAKGAGRIITQRPTPLVEKSNTKDYWVKVGAFVEHTSQSGVPDSGVSTQSGGIS